MEFWFRLAGFLLGLAIGLLLLSWYHLRFSTRLTRLIRNLQPAAPQWSSVSPTALAHAIAAHLEQQQALEQELETWKQICRTAPIGFLQVDEENQLLWCNRQACQLLNIQDCAPTRPRLLLELVRSYELDELIEQTRTACQPCQRDWMFHPVSVDQSTLSQQQPFPLRGYSFPLRNGVVGVFLESRQEALLLVQQRDRWTSDVAHELKTPLTSIRLVAETLQTRLEPPLRNWVDRLLKETIRLSSLVQDLLDLSQLEARSRIQLNLSPIDLAKLVQLAWSGLEPLARRKQIQLDYQGPHSVLIQADEARLHRVLINLLDNGIKYSPAQQTIQVQISFPPPELPTKHYVCLSVIDTGPGFAASALPHVFDRFYRADPSRSRGWDTRLAGKDLIEATEISAGEEPTAATPAEPETSVPVSSGSGLGLSIVRQIVEAHQGFVKASNHPETQGAWLQVFLPYQPQQRGQDSIDS